MGLEIWNKFSSKYDMVTSLLFIINIWKSDHHLNMTLGTDIKITLSFLSSKSFCWWKWVLSYFKTQQLWSENSLNTNGWGLSGDVDSAGFSVSYTSVTSIFQGRLLLSDSCFLLMIYAPQSPAPFPHECACANFHSPKVYWGFKD